MRERWGRLGHASDEVTRRAADLEAARAAKRASSASMHQALTSSLTMRWRLLQRESETIKMTMYSFGWWFSPWKLWGRVLVEG